MHGCVACINHHRELRTTVVPRGQYIYTGWHFAVNKYALTDQDMNQLNMDILNNKPYMSTGSTPTDNMMELAHQM